MRKNTLLTIVLAVLVFNSCATKSYTRDEIVFQEDEFAILSKESMKPITGILVTEFYNGGVRGTNEVIKGQPHGKAVIYDRDGNIEWELNYKKGMLDGIVKYYVDDTVLEYSLKDNMLHGTLMGYDKGVLVMSREHNMGKPHGVTNINEKHFSATLTYDDGVFIDGSITEYGNTRDQYDSELEAMNNMLLDIDNKVLRYRFYK